MKQGPITRKSGNRRLTTRSAMRKNEHLLDVKVRARTVRRQRNRRVSGMFFFAFFLIALCIGGYYGGTYLLNRFFFQNPAYALHHIDVELDDAMSREDFMKETGLKEENNIFSINLATVEARLLKDPRVSSVHIERTLPDKIAIQIVHRRPVAWISFGNETFSPDNGYLIGMDGMLMKPKKTTPEYLALPVITGIPTNDLHDGDMATLPVLRAALSLIETNERTPGSLLQIRTIDGSREYRLSVGTEQKTQILFALQDFDEQIARLNTLLTNCRETGRQMESVNLMVHRNTPVRFVMADAVQPPKGNAPVHIKTKTTRIQ